ncbi:MULTISPECIES: site-specific integrase [Bacillus cereus group]|uniref:site-specific integrase n=1 Tax=Bacillus cereus group TaxID=86661 RepID=UPI0021D1159B|nr:MULTISPECIES: site-specific integrase [Bacillus cereus group]MCU5201630.1 site-specific integrase [Bacillus paranthracis]MCU5374710.1 site-specific integrase [Bacillus pacificus]
MKHIRLGEISAGFEEYKIIDFEYIEGTFCNFKLKIDLDGTTYDRVVEVTYFVASDIQTTIYMQPVFRETFVDQAIILNMLYDEIKEKYEELRKPYRLKDVTGKVDRNIEKAELVSLKLLKCQMGYLKTFGDLPAAIEKLKVHNENYKTYFVPVRRDYKKYIDSLDVVEKTKKSYFDSLEVFFRYMFDFKIERLEIFDEKDINDFIVHSVQKEDRKTSYLKKVMTSVLDYTRYKKRFLDKKKIEWIEHKTKPQKKITKQRLELIESSLYAKYEKLVERDDFLPKLSKLRDGKRNYILFKMLLELGCNIEELILCNLEDVAEENGTQGIWIKGRFVPLREKTYESIVRYVRFRKAQDLQIEIEKWEIGYMNKRLREQIKAFSVEYARPELWEKYEETREQFEKDGTIDNNDSKLILNNMMWGICSSGIYNYVKKNFVFNNSLFVSNRYNRISKVTCMEILRKVGVTSTGLREYAIQEFFNHGMELEDIIRLVGNLEGLKMDNYIIKEETNKKKPQDIESDLPDREI